MASEAVALVPSSPQSGALEFSFDSVADQLFKKVENCVYDLRTGQLGVLRPSRDAYAVFVPAENGKKAQLQVCPVTAFGLPIPAYAIRTTIDQLKAGDVVIFPGSGSETWLYHLTHDEEGDQIQNASVRGIRVEDGVKAEVMLSDSPFVPSGSVLCVKNVIGKQGELTRMLPMLALLGGGGKGEEGKDKLSKLILCMLMGQGGDLSGGQGFDMKSMLPMMMLSGSGGGGDGFLTAMLLQSGGLFGGRH